MRKYRDKQRFTPSLWERTYPCREKDRQTDGRTDSWVDPCTQFQVSFFEFNLQEKYEHGFHHYRIIKRKLWGQFGKGLSEFLLPQVHSK